MSYWSDWYHKRKAKADALGIPVEELPDMRRVVTNRSNFYSAQHHAYLYSAAWVIKKQFPGLHLDVDELVNVAWCQYARYYKDISGGYKRILNGMFKFALLQYNGVAFRAKRVPTFVGNADEVMDDLPFRENERPSLHDNSNERVDAVLKLCSAEERELLHLHFDLMMTWKEVAKFKNKSFLSIQGKYQYLYKRIREQHPNF